MLAVAGVAIVLWAGVTLPSSLYAGIPLAVPMIGALWGGHRANDRDRLDGSVVGGIVAALIQAVVVVALWLFFSVPWWPSDVEQWLFLVVIVALVMLASFTLGAIAGALAGVGLGLTGDRRQGPS